MIKYLQAAELLKEVGLDSEEFIERAKFLESVRIAVDLKREGFRGDWVCCSHINSTLHPKKWAGLLDTLGYVLHPTMAETGRSSRPVNLGRSTAWLRLFVKKGSAAESIEGEKEAIYEFRRAQM